MTDWTLAAACRGLDPALFVLDEGDRRIPEAIAVCDRCPVRADCEAHGISHDEPGIWGGLTQRERRRKRQAAGVPPAYMRCCAWCRRRFEAHTRNAVYCCSACRVAANSHGRVSA